MRSRSHSSVDQHVDLSGPGGLKQFRKPPSKTRMNSKVVSREWPCFHGSERRAPVQPVETPQARAAQERGAPLLPGLAALAVMLLAGCSTQRFATDYYLDPRPPRISYSELTAPTNPQPVYLVFDMYSTQGSFREATQKLGPKIVHVLKDSGMFSSVSGVG